MLKIEDLKISDKLVCLDVEAYLNIDNQWVLSGRKIVVESSLIVDHIYENGALGLEDTNYCIPVSDFQYFKKEEESTFNDLIDVAVQAVKDKVINGANIRLHEIGFMYNKTHYKLMPAFDCKEQIDLIKSLYKETFVIESIEQMNKITFKKDAKITLSNGEVLHESVIYSLSKFNNDVAFCVLKGATVEQSK